MLKQQCQSSVSDNERLYTILEKVDAVLAERRTRQTLVSELLKAQYDIEFLENKIGMAKSNLQRETPELVILKESSEKAALTFSRLVKERETAEAKYFRVKIYEKDFNAKIALLPKINEETFRLGGRVGKLKSECKAQDTNFQKVVSQKEKFQTEIIELNQRIETLIDKMPIMKNTKDIILGLMPSDFDKDSYEILQGNFEKNLKNYMDEINSEIKTIDQRVSDLKELQENENSLQLTLLAENADLDAKYNSILSDIGGETDKSKVLAALNQLKSQKDSLITDSGRLTNAIDRIKSEIVGLDENLAHEKTVKAELMQQDTYLTSLKQELDGIDDMDAQIQFQKEKNLNLAAEADTLNRKIDLVSKINQELDAITDELQIIYEDHNRQWLEYVGPLYNMIF
jgi:DNA repair exonuclease SbcCD ATPase subunit